MAQTETQEMPFKQEKNSLLGWLNTRTGCPQRLQCLGAVQNTTSYSLRNLPLVVNPASAREGWASDL